MKTETSRSKKEFTHIFLCYLVFTSLMFTFHLLINFSDDDLIFGSVLNNTSPFEYINLRYNGWSSRVFIEIILIYFSRCIWAWRVVDTLLISLLIYSINKLIFKKTSVYNTILTMLMVCTYPFFHLKSAGYCATTLNYSWVLSLMMFSFIPLQNVFYNEKLKVAFIPFYIIAAIFACNQEQGACIVFAISLLFTIYCFIRKKNKLYPIALLIVAILSLIFILTCPGNTGRDVLEAQTFFPHFNDLNILQKSYLGIMVAMATLFKGPFIYLLFSFVCLLYAIYTKANKITIVFISVYMALCLFLNIMYLCTLIFNYFSTYINYALINTYIIDKDFININSIFNKEFALNIILIVGSLLMPILLLKKQSLPIVLLLLIGYASRFILSFSPTLVASSSRTSIFLLFAFIITTLYLSSKFYLKKPYKKILIIGVSALTTINIILSIANILKPILIS